jgi:hypothetical protein
VWHCKYRSLADAADDEYFSPIIAGQDSLCPRQCAITAPSAQHNRDRCSLDTEKVSSLIYSGDGRVQRQPYGSAVQESHPDVPGE